MLDIRQCAVEQRKWPRISKKTGPAQVPGTKLVGGGCQAELLNRVQPLNVSVLAMPPLVWMLGRWGWLGR
jgi:hypothetical protein